MAPVPRKLGSDCDRQCKRTSVLLGAGKMVASAMIAAHRGWKCSHRLLVKDIWRRNEGLGIPVVVSCTRTEAFCSRSERTSFNRRETAHASSRAQKNETTSPSQKHPQAQRCSLPKTPRMKKGNSLGKKVQAVSLRGSYSARVPRSSLAEVHREFVHHIVEDEVDGQEERQDD